MLGVLYCFKNTRFCHLCQPKVYTFFHRGLSSGLLIYKYDSSKNTALETVWKQCQQISLVYITFDKHTYRRCLYQYKGWKPFWIWDDLPPAVQYLFIHSKPTIQYIIVARITAAMIFLKDNILVTDRDVFYHTKTYKISSTGGHFVSRRSRKTEVINM
jgi:hypothetical protein